MTWAVLYILFALGVFFIWWRYSRHHTTPRMLSEKDVGLYLDVLMDRLGLPPHLRQSILTDTVVSERYLLHLDIFPADKGEAAVVFVPGTAVYALVYTEFMYKLSQKGFHVIGFDPRGHGRSQGRRACYTIDELVRDTRAVIDYARRHYSPNVFLAGSSQGGIVAFYAAATEASLKGAICHNLADLADPETVRLARSPTLARVCKPLLALLARLIPDFQIPISFYLDLRKEETRLFGNAKRFLDQDPLTLSSISLRAMASLASTPLPCSVHEVPTPIMILHAENDNIFPLAYVEKIYRRLPEPKRLHLVQGRPHLLLTDYVDEILPPVEAWMREMLSRSQAG